MAVNIGTIEGVIRLRDEFTSTLSKASTRFVQSAANVEKSNKAIQREVDRLAKSYQRLSADLDPVVKRQQRYEQAQSILNRSLKSGTISQVDYNRQLALAKTKYLDAGAAASKYNHHMSGVVAGVKAAVVAFVGFQALRFARAELEHLVNANIEAEQSLHRLEAASIRAGSSLPIDKLLKLADAYSRLTGVDDEVIADAEAILLRYNRIGSDIFPKVVKAALDLAAATGQDLSAAMEKAGKMVNNPLRALTLLNREGYAVSASQSKMVKDLLRTNDIAGAQGVILEILNRQYGDAATAARDTFGGAIQALGTTWENFLERIGEDHTGPLRQGIESLITLLEKATDNWTKFEIGANVATANVNRAILKVIDSLLALVETGAKIQGALSFGAADAAAKNLQKTVTNLRANVSKSFGKTISDADQAAAKAMIRLLVQEGKFPEELARKLGLLGNARKKATGLILEQTEAEDKLNKKLGEQASELANLRSELLLNLAQTREMTAAVKSGNLAAIENLEKIHPLHRLYLQDVDRFGRKAADGLAVLRRAGADAKQELDLFKDIGEKWDAFVAEATKKSRTINEEAAKEMEDFTRQVFNATFVDWTEFNDKVKAAVQARADERIALESEVWSFTATGFELAIADARAWHDDFVRRIKSAVDRGVISVIDAEEKLAAARKELIETEAKIRVNTLIGELGSIFNFLEDQFGSLFSHIAKLINQIQQAQQFGQSVTNVASVAGMSASSAGTLGTVASVLGVWKAIYDIGMNILKENKLKKFGQAGTVDITGGISRTGVSAGVGQVSTEAIRAIQSVIKAFEDALRISVIDLEEIGIKLRNDGKKVKAYVEGRMIGVFNDVNEAIEAALSIALTSGKTVFSNITDLMTEGLKSIRGRTQDLDEIVDFLAQLREIGDLGLPQGAIQAQEATRRFDELWKALGRLKQGTSAVLQGINNLVSAEISMFQSWLDSITGRQKTDAEILEDKRRELVFYKIEIELRKAIARQRIIEINSIIAAIKAGNMLIGGTGGGGIGGGGTGGGVLGVAKAFSVAGSVITHTAAVVTAATITISQAGLDMIAALEQEAAALQRLIDSIPEPPDPSTLRLPRAGGGVGDNRDQLRDFIEQRGFELGLAGLSEYARRIAEIGREYEQQLEQAGRDVKLRHQLIDLKERELALLAKEQKESLADRFREFLGLVTPFDQIRETAAALIKDIEESPFGDERKARMIGRVLEDLERQIEQLAQESALSLLGQLAQDLEKFGADEILMAEVRRNMAIIEHTLKLEHYRVEIAILKAQNKLTADVLKTIDDAFKFLEGVDPTKILGGVLDPRRFKGYDDVPINEIANKLKDALDSALRTLEDLEREALSPLVQDLLELQGKFKPIYEALGHVARVENAYASQLKLIMQRHFGAINDLLDSLETSDLSPLRTIDQFGISLAKFRNAFSAVLTGDFAKLEEIPDLVQTLLALTRQVRPLGSQGYRDVFEEVQAALRQLASMAGLPTGVLTQLSSGVGLGNLLLPNNFASVNQPLAADVSVPIVDTIGRHSDRQILVLRSMDERLGSIQLSTETLVSIGEYTSSVLSQVL